MKITCISDTHNKHNQIPIKYLEGGDMIIHAGDMSSVGYKNEIRAFLNWYSKLPYTHKILIAGNHDFFFEQAPEYEIEAMLAEYPEIIYLNDSGVEIDGLNIWGSPIQPWFHNWAFNKVEETIGVHWDLIPMDTNILITHGPVRGYLDMTLEGDLTGCPVLLEKIKELKELKLHVCGHIHEAHGRYLFCDGIEFVNASVLDRRYVMKNAPTEIILNK